MNITDAHWHLLFNHFPIILSITATGLLILAFFIRNKAFTQTALFILVLAAITAIPAFNTGEMAEEVVESMPNVDHGLIHQHEESANTAYIMLLISGGLAVLLMLYNRTSQAIRLIPLVVVLAGALASAGFMAKAGYDGGKIRHTEIQNVTSSTPQNLYSDDDDD